jgi:hypothetical protein
MKIVLIALSTAGGAVVAGTGALLGYLAHLDRQDDKHDREALRRARRGTDPPDPPRATERSD